ncbi:cell division protein FtsA [Massilibacteroides sp.]|uniref:cell division protein FtsA n=1 Tax=Massilibacteroides sp. TaxID=2034766 RepID=UPI002636AEB5|nr:cell division protein FtsA [Massilibacteroides sp.]MDD4515349.1 cell division protein FtsA [Massilibacteroides sp.]
MQYTNFITAIDLGTSRMVGIVGIKNPTGSISIIAHEVENSGTCIRRGCVYNVEETANKVKHLIQKLENKLHGTKIGKVYVGVGGMSLHSIDHTVPHILGEDGIVSENTIDSLYKECQQFRPDMLDVLAAVSPTYYIDNQVVDNPVGVPGNKIEARYKLIVARPSLRSYILSSIRDRAKIEIAGILVSPLAMADVVLTADEKNLGCALIGFGAGVTTLTIYKGGKLEALSVIPLGSHLITKDIMNLRIVETEAERLKCAYGSAIMDKDDDSAIQVSSADGVGLREIPLSDFNNIIEARIGEILENVYARLEETGLKNELGAGVIITGGGATLKNLTEVIRERLKVGVRCSSVRKGIVSSGDIDPVNSEYAVAIGLLMQGTENCAIPQEKSTDPQPTLFGHLEEEEVPKPTAEPKKPKSPKEKKGGLFSGWRTKVDNMTKDLFDGEL